MTLTPFKLTLPDDALADIFAGNGICQLSDGSYQVTFSHKPTQFSAKQPS